jgi:hypothetical protein
MMRQSGNCRPDNRTRQIASTTVFVERREASKLNRLWKTFMHLTSAQLALLIEGIDWRRTVAPEAPELTCH